MRRESIIDFIADIEAYSSNISVSDIKIDPYIESKYGRTIFGMSLIIGSTDEDNIRRWSKQRYFSFVLSDIRYHEESPIPLRSWMELKNIKHYLERKEYLESMVSKNCIISINYLDVLSNYMDNKKRCSVFEEIEKILFKNSNITKAMNCVLYEEELFKKRCEEKNKEDINKRINNERRRKTYIMKDEHTGFFKIGKSHNPEKREKTLISIKPTISLLYIAHKDIEKDLHIKFSHKRIRGEWFELSPIELEETIYQYKFKKAIV